MAQITNLDNFLTPELLEMTRKDWAKRRKVCGSFGNMFANRMLKGWVLTGKSAEDHAKDVKYLSNKAEEWLAKK